MSKALMLDDVNGVLLVNKPPGLTSNAVLQQVKRIFKAKKAGHTGSLDPMATGMLPVCFGEATKFCQYLLDADKCYEVTGLLGTKTNTGDATGDVIAEEQDVVVSADKLEQVLANFLGPIKQVPPMFSALKHQGQPLYKYARAGVDIERKAREIFIHQLQLNHFDGRSLSLTVTCSKGTYIRNLIEDIAEQLGTYAHVTRLHRLYTAGFNDEAMFTVDDLKNQSDEQRMSCLLPLDRAVSYLPRLVVSEDAAQALRQGKIVNEIGDGLAVGCVRLYQNDVDFFGLGELQDNGVLKVKRLLSFTI
jgi:tRNA pseudouridine55 synthase